ncbi:hypothetical protein HPB48_011707 [Haemaphysalis longicornis]|uniref:Ionotropic glutamate receptor C-terminal domain-containing protein n=1 Tax=Haemaphysalis longicornis TaxID=44386 RepID=A0A9J6H4A3_HAELO|nr:hypothetical protein HPB48_011707 [Haemaphysalis longicornis]
MTLVTATSTKFWLRLLVGAWLLISLLMSTVFRGALTTMLQNIPTKGRLPEFHTVASKQRLGYSSSYVLCGNNSLYERMKLMYNIPGATGVCWAETYERPSSKRVYVLDNVAEELAENLTQILDSLGYVWLGQDTLNWLAGPVVAFGSPYKDAIATVTAQAFEGGLFEVPTALENFRFKYRREIRLVNSVRVEFLSTDSFEPHFIVLYIGFAISVTIFALEILSSQKCLLQFGKNIRRAKKFY